MIYKEKNIKWHWAALILIVAFFILYAPWQVGARELYWSEGRFAAMASEVTYFPPMALAHHELIPQSFPMFPIIASVLTGEFGIPMEFSLRIISIAALAFIALLVWETCRHSSGTAAAAVGVAVLISSNIVIEKTVDGYPDMLGIMFLFTAWVSWFRLGVYKGNWNSAWIISTFLCALGFYTIGWMGILYFFVPLIFMRRPLTLWPKLRRPGFYFGVVILISFILLWGLPRIFAEDIPVRMMDYDFISLEDYFYHLIAFPVDVVMRFFPWSLIAWAPFCVALHPLDDNPIFNRFLRIITISLFFLLWFSPFTEPRDIVLLAPPLAAMCGSYYGIVVRRYGYYFQKVLELFPYFALICGLSIIAFYLAPAKLIEPLTFLSRGTEYRSDNRQILIALISGGFAILMGIYFLIFKMKSIPVWASILSVLCIVMIFFWTMTHPYKAQESSKRTIGGQWRETIEKYGDMPDYVYKGKNIAELYAECFYLGTGVKKINSLDDLPENEKVVFLICTDPPRQQLRSWNQLLKRSYRRGELFLFKGEIKTDKLSKDN